MEPVDPAKLKMESEYIALERKYVVRVRNLETAEVLMQHEIPLAPPASEPQQQPTECYVFIDGSNLCITSAMHATRITGLRDVPHTKARKGARVNMVDLVKLVLVPEPQRTLAHMYITIADTIRSGRDSAAKARAHWGADRCEVKVCATQYRDDGRARVEKQADTSICVQVVRCAARLAAAQQQHRAVLILVSGDVDFWPAVETATQEYGCHVELWAYDRAVHKDWYTQPHIAVHPLVPVHDQFAYIKYSYKIIPKTTTTTTHTSTSYCNMIKDIPASSRPSDATVTQEQLPAQAATTEPSVATSGDEVPDDNLSQQGDCQTPSPPCVAEFNSSEDEPGSNGANGDAYDDDVDTDNLKHVPTDGGDVLTPYETRLVAQSFIVRDIHAVFGSDALKALAVQLDKFQLLYRLEYCAFKRGTASYDVLAYFPFMHHVPDADLAALRDRVPGAMPTNEYIDACQRGKIGPSQRMRTWVDSLAQRGFQRVEMQAAAAPHTDQRQHPLYCYYGAHCRDGLTCRRPHSKDDRLHFIQATEYAKKYNMPLDRILLTYKTRECTRKVHTHHIPLDDWCTFVHPGELIWCTKCHRYGDHYTVACDARE